MSGLQHKLRRSWSPRGFLQRFGAEQVQMIDCRDGKSVHWLTLGHFFAGYLQVRNADCLPIAFQTPPDRLPIAFLSPPFPSQSPPNRLRTAS